MNANAKAYLINPYQIAFRPWFLVCAIWITFLLSGCVTNNPDNPSRASFELHKCGPSDNTQCVVPLFMEGADINKRQAKDFPQHYLELYNEQIRVEDCKKMGVEEKTCIDQLNKLANYFNPKGAIPKDWEIGVALEGGGTKAASFALGTLAGLQELGILEIPKNTRQDDQGIKDAKSVKVGAISSVSGGSYAASYLYNRWFDHLVNSDTTDE